MNQELFTKIQSLRPFVDALWSNKDIKMTVANQEVLKSVWTEIMKGQRLNLACVECVKYSLMVAQSYYEREFPKWQQSQQPVAPVVDPEVTKDTIKEVVKNAGKRSNK